MTPAEPRSHAGGDRPYLISGADDRLIKVWDYQTKACVTTLEVRQCWASMARRATGCWGSLQGNAERLAGLRLCHGG